MAGWLERVGKSARRGLLALTLEIHANTRFRADTRRYGLVDRLLGFVVVNYITHAGRVDTAELAGLGGARDHFLDLRVGRGRTFMGPYWREGGFMKAILLSMVASIALL